MDTGETRQTPGVAAVGADVVRAAGQVVTALAAAVGFIYLVGGLIIWLRLWLISTPQLAVVSELPREVVISVGLVVVALALGVGAIYAFWRLVVHPGDETPPRLPGGIRQTLVVAPGRVVLWGAMLAAPTCLIFAFAGSPHDRWIGTLGFGRWYGLPAALAAAWVLAAIWAFFSLRLWGKLGETYWISANKKVEHQEFEVDRAKALSERARENAAHARDAATIAREAAERANEDAKRAREAARDAPDDSAESSRLKEDELRAEMENVRADSEKRRADEAEEKASRAAAYVQEVETRVPGGSRERVESLAVEAFNTPAAVAISAVLWSVVWVPAFLVAAVSLPLAEARACVAGDAFDGEFIGETSERIYLSDASGDRIASIPLADVDLVYIGDAARGNDGKPCPKPSPTSP